MKPFWKPGNIGENLPNIQATVIDVTTLKTASEAIADAIDALKQQARALKEVPYKDHKKKVICQNCKETFFAEVGINPDVVARSMAYTAKVIDEITRLSSFLQGGPDSRPDIGLNDLLEFLTPDQFEQFQKWVEEKKAITVQ